MKTSTFKLFVVLFCVLANSAFSQIILTPAQPHTGFITFDIGEPSSIGTTTSVVLPTGFKVAQSTSVNTIPPYPITGGDTLEHIGGDTLSSTASSGTYNFGAGIPQTAIDRSIGFLASATTGLKTGVLYLHLKNSTGNLLNAFSISFDAEIFKNGMNPAGFKITLHSSIDGTNWTPAPDGEILFIADLDNNGYVSAPDISRTISPEMSFYKNFPNNSDLYFAWVYTVTSGTNTSDAQALAIDNVAVYSEYNPLLPIELHSFSAKAAHKKVKINWTTATEINNDKFIVEKSSDGKNFEYLTEVEGAGNSKELNAYEVVDTKPFKGDSYYRLKQIDFNGKSEVFGPVAVRTEDAGLNIETWAKSSDAGNTTLRIYANESTEVTLSIRDLSGRTIVSEKIKLTAGYQNYTLNNPLLSTGLHVVQLSSDSEVVSRKIVL